MRLLVAVLALLVLAQGEVLAFDVSTANPGLDFGYTCSNNGGTRECTCSGDEDCEDLEFSEECEWFWDTSFDHPQRRTDITCTGEGADRSCTCPWAREVEETDHRPDSYAPASENAPRGGGDSSIHEEEVPRAGGGSRVFDSETISRERRENEVVRARRGNAPAQDAATEVESETEVTTRRTVRDHRRSPVHSRHTESEEDENRRIEEMRREAEALERQLQELEGGGG